MGKIEASVSCHQGPRNRWSGRLERDRQTETGNRLSGPEERSDLKLADVSRGHPARSPDVPQRWEGLSIEELNLSSSTHKNNLRRQ
jgi:hypothetical protein